MAEAMLKDATVWRWWFYLRWHGHDQSERLESYWKAFNQSLNSAVEWSGGWQESRVAQPEKLPRIRQTNAHLASIPWRESSGVLRTLEARMLLDVLYIQSGCAQEGTAVPEDVSLLMKSAWPGDESAASLLGDAVCLTVETGELREDEAKQTARTILERWTEKQVRQIELVELDPGYFAIPTGLEDEVWALLVRDNDRARQEAAHFVHRLMPPLLLARLKGQVVMQKFEQHLLSSARALEIELNEELNRIIDQPRRLKMLEQASYSLSHLQAKLAEKSSQCEESLETLRVNADNIERLLSDPLIAARKTNLDELLAAPLRLYVEQVAADLRYLAITQTQAERVLQGIATMAEVRSARWERTITVLFGLFVLFGITGAFPELTALALRWRIGGFFICAIILSIFIWWLSRRE